MMDDRVVLITCNGLSARGQLTAKVIQQLQEHIDEDVDVLSLTPLLAGLPERVEKVKRATQLIGLAGCSRRCDLHACRSQAGRVPDVDLVLEDILRKDITSEDTISQEELNQVLPKATSLLLGKLT